MRNVMIVLFLFALNCSFSQNIFHSQCWENTSRELNSASIIIAIVNSYDNTNERGEGRKPVVIYYRDSLLNWKGKLVLVDLQKMTWQETTLSVDYIFQNFLNDSLDNIKSTFSELLQDPKRDWGTIGHIELYYRDSSSELINDYYSVSSGVNSLFIKQPLVFYLYSYAMNKSFNIKFQKRIKYH